MIILRLIMNKNVINNKMKDNRLNESYLCGMIAEMHEMLGEPGEIRVRKGNDQRA